MQRITPHLTGETYHVYNRGAHKSELFRFDEDYRRFLLLLFLCNQDAAFEMRTMYAKYKGRPFADIYKEERVTKELVHVLAYCLMPNHFHLIVRQKREDGIERFMRRVATGYSMYFNLKYEHSGTMFQGRYKSTHAEEDRYLRWLFAYVHLNPVAIKEPDWEERGVRNPRALREFVRGYPYSSYQDYRVATRPETNILSVEEAHPDMAKDDELEEMLATFTEDRPPYASYGGRSSV